MSQDVKNASDEQKKNFLKKKGLSDDEIIKAFQLTKEKIEQKEQVEKNKIKPDVTENTSSVLKPIS